MEDENMLFSTKFQTRDQVVEEARRYYASKGYALSIRDSRKDKYVVLRCDRGGNYRNKRNIPMEARKKTSSSRLINCPFTVKGKKETGGCWTLELGNNSHNHDPSKDMSGHPSSRCLTEEEIRDVEKMSMAGIEPRQILSLLREKNSNLQAVARTIYNMKAKLEIKNLGERSLVQALFEELEKGDFTFHYLKDDSGNITHLFFAHAKSITLARMYNITFVIDCTYKTNKYGMPLLDIIGITSFNKSFYAGFAFISKEKTKDYIWALQMFSNVLGPNYHPSVIVTDREQALISAIEVVFPTTTHLLCVWHIQKNVVAKLKGLFNDEDDWDVFKAMWDALIYAETEEEFNESWLFIQLLYKEKKDAITYLENTWISEKEKFVSAWTEKYIHFGNRASSRAEGAHAKLKKYLQVSTGNLRQVKNKICLAVENEFHELKTQCESEKIRVPHKHNILYFKELIYRVSIFALKKLHKQYEMVVFGTLKPVCTGTFSSTMGLPCAHMMGDWKNSVLPLELIHSQWRIDSKSFSYTGDEIEMDNNEIEMKGMLDKLYDMYKQWPAYQKVELKKKIHRILTLEDRLVTEPHIQTRKRKRGKSKKGEGYTSTRRDPSQFERVEAESQSRGPG